MERYLVCGNPGCKLVFDTMLNGATISHGQQEFYTPEVCPECGGAWAAGAEPSREVLARVEGANFPLAAPQRCEAGTERKKQVA
jgi:hypothetical protein